MRKIILLFLILSSIAFKASAQFFGGNWSPGFFYDVKGDRFDGLLQIHPAEITVFSSGQDFIYFKNFKKDHRIKIPSDSLVWFAIKTDTFFVSHSPEFNKTRFLRVIINSGIKLYLSETLQASTSMSMGTSTERYYYGPDPNHITKLKNKNFIEAMSDVMADRPGIDKYLKDKTFEFEDLDKLLTFYRTGQITISGDKDQLQ